MNVIIYSRKTCPPCQLVKRWLNMKNVAYQEKSLDDNPELMSEVQERTGFSMVPMILVGEKVVSGANLGLLSELLMV